MKNMHEKHFARFASLKLRRINLRRPAPAIAQSKTGVQIQPGLPSAASIARMMSLNLVSTH